MKDTKITDRQGFTLLEILLVIGIMGVIAVFTIGISHSIRNMTKANDTKSRMEQIAAKAREFYRAHENLPAPGGGAGGTEVPVGASDLNMEQKFRLDGWGQYFFYNRAVNTSPVVVDGITWAIGSLPVIRGVRVNGKDAAGVIISLGPNQSRDYTTTTTGLPAPVQIAYTTAGDDILIPIDVSQEAGEIAIEELKVLQAKVKAFDALYEGIDNSNPANNTIDESGCVAQPSVAGQCPPYGVISTIDPNCGTATLDFAQANNYAGCSTSCNAANCNWGSVTSVAPFTSNDRARAFIYCLYCLSNDDIVDPWLRGYVWGSVATYAVSNPRYHKFFSAGPDGTTGNADDIIP